MTRVLLIDADIIAYKAAFAVEKTFEFGPGEWATTADLGEATEKAEELIASLVKDTKAEKVIVCLTHADNWRKAILPSYKAQRTKVRKPILLKQLRGVLEGRFTCYERAGLEADDCLGILATRPAKGTQPIVASIDKDLLQVPGLHINIDSHKRTMVTEAEGNMRHFMQTLTGDVVDNYGGCPGVGKVGAEKILTKVTTDAERWQAIVKAYEKKGLTEEDALVQARVARICRASDYDFKSAKPILWTPPNGA